MPKKRNRWCIDDVLPGSKALTLLLTIRQTHTTAAVLMCRRRQHSKAAMLLLSIRHTAIELEPYHTHKSNVRSTHIAVVLVANAPNRVSLTGFILNAYALLCSKHTSDIQ